MIKLKNNNGITLAVLIVTILVMVILLAITIDISTDTVDSTIDSQDRSELLMVQHAIQQRYTEYLETNDIRVLVGKYKSGTKYQISSVETLSSICPSKDKVDYYIAIKSEEKALYYINNGVPKEISVYRNAITNSTLHEAWIEEVTNNSYKLDGFDECYKVNQPNAINVNCFQALGITGEGIKKAKFEVDYRTGAVKKIGGDNEIKGYNKGTNITSNMIDID